MTSIASETAAILFIADRPVTLGYNSASGKAVQLWLSVTRVGNETDDPLESLG
ncbi:hypothetical protein [Natronorubrum halophilum]|uniref:hypothetical protein n=1 Tax=Natronorubrum halophilum TaxID=1702106 RepID=UPI0013CF21E0|nr:hypothetical protein [Natronorubrum halophilum]